MKYADMYFIKMIIIYIIFNDFLLNSYTLIFSVII